MRRGRCEGHPPKTVGARYHRTYVGQPPDTSVLAGRGNLAPRPRRFSRIVETASPHPIVTVALRKLVRCLQHSLSELEGIIDLSNSNPAVDIAFNGASCGASCTNINDPACSCTQSFSYWSATTHQNGPGLAWNVNFLTIPTNGDYKFSATPTGGASAISSTASGDSQAVSALLRPHQFSTARFGLFGTVSRTLKQVQVIGSQRCPFG